MADLGFMMFLKVYKQKGRETKKKKKQGGRRGRKADKLDSWKPEIQKDRKAKKKIV